MFLTEKVASKMQESDISGEKQEREVEGDMGDHGGDEVLPAPRVGMRRQLGARRGLQGPLKVIGLKMKWVPRSQRKTFLISFHTCHSRVAGSSSLAHYEILPFLFSFFVKNT